MVRMLVALRGGGVLLIEHRPPHFLSIYVARPAAIPTLVISGCCASGGATVAQRTEAARRFSIHRAAPDLVVTGPRELREIALAFNEMQSQIRDLVAERDIADVALLLDLGRPLPARAQPTLPMVLSAMQALPWQNSSRSAANSGNRYTWP